MMTQSALLFTFSRVDSTGCPDTLAPPPPQHNWARPHAKPIYFHDPTSIPDLHARFQITNLICLLPVTWFMMRGRAHFCEQILHNFLGCFHQNGYKSVNNWRRPLYDISFKS